MNNDFNDSFVLEVQSGTSMVRGRAFKSDAPTANTGIVGATINTTDTFIAGYLFQNNTIGGAEFFLDGVSAGTANTVDMGPIPVNRRPSIGDHPSANVGFNGDILEILIYDRVPNDIEHQQVGVYLESK